MLSDGDILTDYNKLMTDKYILVTSLSGASSIGEEAYTPFHTCCYCKVYFSVIILKFLFLC